MKLFIAKEPGRQETRAAMLPSDAGKLIQLGAEVEVAAGIGRAINVTDEEYEKAGAKVSSDSKASLVAEMVLRVGVPDTDDVEQIGEGAIHVSLLDPFNNTEVVQALAARRVSAISLEMIPRTTIAQKMDVLSSQANLAGYVAVILAASRQNKILPMMMTPAGTIAPARVFVIGAGVAGLQAIATAKRLGARVDAFDVRPDAQEQILSLGAKPLKVDLGETGQTKDGYAKKLTDEQLAKQREAMARQCALSDIVITTAKVFGKKAPLIVTNEMIDGMQPGSVIVDLAVETGGNVEGSKPEKEVQRHGVTIIGRVELPRRVPVAASQMFSSNLYNFVEHFWHKETKRFILNREDAIIQGCLITHAGEIVHPAIQEAIA
ncbi:NAD(P) transhydrogenase subunit alpha [Anaerobaca lacustris]|uniref:proton-translocating NAD(P)(+) transhydrogenase n=1 Tax=Anaerobaca lacustris TaxID=3044600 RepID=A0AAW6TVG1_9BACT|nr:NAD(P) transhydrogenase subunit alpha [Sedimentisphaerales bacterium M17dextr]